MDLGAQVNALQGQDHRGVPKEKTAADHIETLKALREYLGTRLHEFSVDDGPVKDLDAVIAFLRKLIDDAGTEEGARIFEQISMGQAQAEVVTAVRKHLQDIMRAKVAGNVPMEASRVTVVDLPSGKWIVSTQLAADIMRMKETSERADRVFEDLEYHLRRSKEQDAEFLPQLRPGGEAADEETSDEP